MSTPKEQTESLLNELLSFAEKLLEKHGELFPFAGIVDNAGRARHLIADAPAQRLSAEAMRRSLVAGLREQASGGDCQLAVLINALSVTDPESGRVIDVIHAAAEHRQGYAADLYLPYTLSEGKLEYGETAAEERVPEFFVGGE